MKHFILFFILIFVQSIWAQTSIKKDNISSDGGSATNGNVQVIYSVGEVAVQENTQANILLSEGFIGPDITATLAIENYTKLSGIDIYPNPVKADLNIKLPETQVYEIYLYDIDGKQLINIQTDNKHKIINLFGYKTNIYMLMVVDRKNRKKGIYKIQKL